MRTQHQKDYLAAIDCVARGKETMTRFEREPELYYTMERGLMWLCCAVELMACYGAGLQIPLVTSDEK